MPETGRPDDRPGSRRVPPALALEAAGLTLEDLELDELELDDLELVAAEYDPDADELTIDLTAVLHLKDAR